MQAKINLVKDCETVKQKLDRPARHKFRTILHINLLVKDPPCPVLEMTWYSLQPNMGWNYIGARTVGTPVSSFCFSSSFSSENKPETHFPTLTNTTSSCLEGW